MSLESQPGVEPTKTIPPVDIPPVDLIKTDGQVPPVEPSKKADHPGDDIADLETAKKVIADLRKENARTRTSKNSVEERLTKFETGLKKLFGQGEEDITIENLTPEKLQKFKDENEASLQEADTRSAILELALEHGVGKESLKYFTFLVSEAASELDEAEELTDERLVELAEEAKGKQASSSTSVDDPTKAGSKAPAPPGPGAVSVEQFSKLSMSAKSDLFKENRPLYDALLAQAREKKILV